MHTSLTVWLLSSKIYSSLGNEKLEIALLCHIHALSQELGKSLMWTFPYPKVIIPDLSYDIIESDIKYVLHEIQDYDELPCLLRSATDLLVELTLVQNQMDMLFL